MNRIFQRIQSYISPKSHAQEKLEDMLIELKGRGISFNIDAVNDEDGQYFVAKSVDYPRGAIVTSGATSRELELNLKDAIFTAFEVPAGSCRPELINIGGEFFKQTAVPSAGTQKVHVTV